MGHLHRFYIPPETPAAPEIALSPEEAHHALHVVRVRAGDRVVLFDGLGRELVGVVDRLTRHDVFVSVDQERRAARPPVHVCLIQAALHREKTTEALIQHGTELGVAEFRFFRAARSERPPRQTDKWLRAVIETCKQCGRLWFPEFSVWPDLAACLADVPGTLLIATRDVDPVPIAQAVAHKPAAVAVLVGPEGDFTPEELRVAHEHNAQPVSLGAFTYRSEVAGPLAASLVLYELGQLGPRP